MSCRGYRAATRRYRAATVRERSAGVTLIEVLIAITLLSLLSVGMFEAIRIGLSAFTRTDAALMDNRRVAGAQRIIEQQIEGLIPVVSPCTGAPQRRAFFQGEPTTMRLVSAFSLQQGWRGQPQILEMFVIPGERDEGVRLVVNEIPYTGPQITTQICVGIVPDPLTGMPLARFLPVVATPASFVLADKLQFCRFVYLTQPRDPRLPPVWNPEWTGDAWPLAVRIEMAPLTPNPSRLQPITTVAPIQIRRSPEVHYVD